MQDTQTPFKHRKIVPYELPPIPAESADYAELVQYSMEKASALNKHILGFGSLAESEWSEHDLPAPNLAEMHKYRLQRLRNQLKKRDLSAAILCDPLNVRYATDCTNMQVWCTHNAIRYCFVATEGPVVLFDFHNSEHLAAHAHQVDEIRPGTSWFYFKAGQHFEQRAKLWAKELVNLIHEHGGGNNRIAIDRVNPEGAAALENYGISLFNGEEILELARAVKCTNELKAMRRAIVACEAAMHKMESSLKSGMTETDLWGILHYENIRRGGEWIETHLLASGPRTNPWFQEASSRVIEDGDLVAFDTDLVGAYGMCCDISRTWLCGNGQPTNEQISLYQMAHEQVQTNTEILKPGVSFLELSKQAKILPDEFMANRYSMLYHGVGLCDEFPSICYPGDWDTRGYDGTLESGMILCVESYVGRHGGYEGVKLEEQVLITETGFERLSKYPYDDRLLPI